MNNTPYTDHGLEVMYRFAKLDPFTRSRYFGHDFTTSHLCLLQNSSRCGYNTLCSSCCLNLQHCEYLLLLIQTACCNALHTNLELCIEPADVAAAGAGRTWIWGSLNDSEECGSLLGLLPWLGILPQLSRHSCLCLMISGEGDSL